MSDGVKPGFVDWLKKLFRRKPKLDHPDADVRIRALREDENLTAEQYTKVAREDADIGVRKVALEVADSTQLYAEFLDDNKLGELARKTIAGRIDDEHELANDARILPFRLQDISDPVRAYELARRMETSDATAEVIFRLPDRETREKILQLCYDEKVLAGIQKASRNVDKSVNRFVRDRIHTIKELDNRYQNLSAQADHVIASAERTLPQDPHYIARRERIEREWDNTIQAMEQLNDQLTEYERQAFELDTLKAKFPDRGDPVASDKVEARQFELILEQLRSSEGKESEIDLCEQQWLDALKESAAPREIADQFYQLANSKRRDLQRQEEVSRRKRTMSQLLEPIVLREPAPDAPHWNDLWKTRDNATNRVRRIERTLSRMAESDNEDLQSERAALIEMSASLENTVNRCNEMEEDIVKHVESNLTSLDRFLDSGLLKKAKSAERNISSLINRLPRKRQSHFNARLTPANAAIRQLAGWQSFAEQPQRIELCETLEALVENPQQPEEQYNHIRDLRAKWNGLGILRSRSDRAMQERFDAAAEKAFEVCKSWFEEQAEVRERNLTGREAIISRLEDFIGETNWERPNFKVVYDTLRKSQTDWRNFTPVSRAKVKDTNDRFYALIRDLESRMSDQWDRNAEAKQDLIEKAKAAVADESLSNADLISTVKNLQSQWKEIGPAGRKKEQRLWTQFRGQCDVAFQRRETQQKQRHAEIESHIKQAKDAVAELGKKVEDSSASLDDLAPSVIANLRTMIGELELPSRIRKSVQEDIAKLSSRVNKRRDELQTARSSEELKAIMDLDQQVAELEAKGETPDSELLSQAGTGQEWFAKRSEEEAAKKTIALHELTLRAEVLADVPSPPEDSGKRMQVQVSRLQHGLTKGGESEEQRVERLIQAWCSSAFGEQPHRERFQFAIRKHLDRLSGVASDSSDKKDD